MITVNITNGPTFTVTWTAGMNAQQAMELAYNGAAPQTFSYALQYFGYEGVVYYGYLVTMINETYESFNSPQPPAGSPSIMQYPYYFWEFLYNGAISPLGIDSTILNDGDVITFEFTPYSGSTDANSTTHAKFKLRKG